MKDLKPRKPVTASINERWENVFRIWMSCLDYLVFEVTKPSCWIKWLYHWGDHAFDIKVSLHWLFSEPHFVFGRKTYWYADPNEVQAKEVSKVFGKSNLHLEKKNLTVV